jgi:molybdopterin-guanine dinucleotide biosynthesis protein A
VAGAAALRAGAHEAHVLLLAVDLPFVEPPMVRLLADWPGDATVVPVAGGARQSCCARYAPDALDIAAALLASGERSLRALLDATVVDDVPEPVWREVASERALADLDTPEDLARYGFT